MAPDSDDRPAIYVVDDDDAVRESLCVLLAVEGLAVTGGASAQALLDRLPQPDLRCVVTDMHMTQMSGIELLRRLKALQPALAVILISGRSSQALKTQAMAAGAWAFLEKPFGPREIVAAVRRALEPSSIRPPRA